MKGQSFINFLREEEGKADRQKVLALSALVGSSVLAQLMFAGVAQSDHHCGSIIDCNPGEPDSSECLRQGCFVSCPAGPGVHGTCYPPM